MMGYGQKLSPYLGIPWVTTAAHLLAGAEADSKLVDGFKKDKKDKPLPAPKLPPNATHSQDLAFFFTHRESPAFVSVALNLYNVTTPSGDAPSSAPPPTDVRPVGRSWKTTEIVPFLGNIALERLSCGKRSAREGDFVRALVNGKGESMGGCQGGPGDSCPFDIFEAWVEARKVRWGGWEEVCAKK
jgi:acid phosphatase